MQGVRGAGRVCVCYSENECTAECESVRVTARLWICVDLSGRVCVFVSLQGCVGQKECVS